MKKQFAVFDWDNTVREGFTLFDWIDYLVNRRILDSSIQHQISGFTKQYENSGITHDDYAHFACRAYAKEIKRKSFSELRNVAGEYIQKDKQRIFNGIDKIFDMLHFYDIDVIVISGAPRIVLDYYKKSFHIRSIRAFKARVSYGTFNGQVAYNYGYNKYKTMLRLEEEYGKSPLFGFGDSCSDIPLLEKSIYPFSINSSIGNATRINTSGNTIKQSDIKLIEEKLRYL